MGDAAAAAGTFEAARLTLVDVPAPRHEWEELVPAPTDPECLGRASDPVPGERPSLDGSYFVRKGDKPSQDLPLFHYPLGAGVDEFLTPEGEEELVRRAKKGDRAARAKIVRKHDPIVARILKPYKQNLWYEELLQEGRKALVRALEMYKPGQGNRFGPYAKRTVRNDVYPLADLLMYPMEPNREVLDFRRREKMQRRQFHEEYGRDPRLGELAARLFAEEWPHEHAALRFQREYGRNRDALTGAEPAPDGVFRAPFFSPPLVPRRVRDVYRQAWEARHDTESRLRAWADGERPETASADAEQVNELVGRLSFLLCRMSTYVEELDARYAVSNENGEIKGKLEYGESAPDGCSERQGHELFHDPRTSPDFLAVALSSQGSRDRAEARGSMVADLLDAVPLTDRMRFCVRGVLGLDGDGFRTPKDLAEELSEAVEHTVRADSIQRTLRRAARRIREHLEGGDVDAVDPFAAEEWAPDRDLLDAFAVAREEEPARWAAAVREVLGEDPDHPAYPPGRSTPRRIGPPPKAGHHIDLPWTLNK